MEVKFKTTTMQNLDSLPVVDGQIIAISDKDDYYYDLGHERRSVSGVVVGSSLPATGKTNKLYIVSSNNEIRLYTYDGQQFCTTGSGNIDDLGPSTTTTYSSSKIESLVDTKQDDLKGSTYVGNIDALYGRNKVYWINISNLPSGNTGALPFDSGYFHLICLSVSANTSTQIAVPFYSTTGSTVSYGQLYYRQCTNSKWYSWRKVHDSTETTSAIDAKLANIQSYFTVATLSKDNISIAGGATVDNSTTGVATAKTNYTALGVVGVDLNNASSSGVGVTNSRILAFGITSTGKAYVQLKNDGTGTSKIKVIYKVLYARTTS